GHHATERYGVRALSRHLNDGLGLTADFLDLPNPV
ncbi:MAG: Nif3-like dinuclear metal center protein, partial [Proteobacteria bacterium]|nr:Nif3-like dinuclear metal center protein [Pseudomonadota bacterium]